MTFLCIESLRPAMCEVNFVDNLYKLLKRCYQWRSYIGLAWCTRTRVTQQNTSKWFQILLCAPGKLNDSGPGRTILDANYPQTSIVTSHFSLLVDVMHRAKKNLAPPLDVTKRRFTRAALLEIFSLQYDPIILSPFRIKRCCTLFFIWITFTHFNLYIVNIKTSKTCYSSGGREYFIHKYLDGKYFIPKKDTQPSWLDIVSKQVVQQ